MSYIMTNADRLALIDILSVSSNLTITGLDTQDILMREWHVMAMANPEKGYVGRGCTIAEAVTTWFELAGLSRPQALSIYAAKAEFVPT